MINFYDYLKNLKEMDLSGMSPINSPLKSTHELQQYQKGDDKYFVKFPKPISFSEYTPDMQSIVEHLAYQIYRAFGVKVPQSYLVLNQQKNTIGVATSGVKGTLPQNHLPLLGHKDISMGFFVDAFLANWDVMGLLYDNIIISDDGQAYRIDPGGALTYRAQGGRKGNRFSNMPGEIDTLRNAEYSPQAGKIFSRMSEKDIEHAGAIFTSVPWSTIENIVVSTKGEALDKINQIVDPVKKTKLQQELNQDFNEINTKLMNRYSEIVKFINQGIK